jgi:hypothetical protein
MAVIASKNDMLGAVDIPGIASRIAHGQGCTGSVGQVVVVPLSVEPQLMDMVVSPSEDDMLGTVDIPGITIGKTCSQRGTSGIGQIVVVPLAIEPHRP